MDGREFDQLVEQSTEYVRACNNRAVRRYGLGSYERYEFDLRRGEIWWSNPDGPKVRAQVILAGTTSKETETWLWAWANPFFHEIDIGPIGQVRDFGEEEGIRKLVDAKWEAGEVDGWEMAAVSARLLEEQGVYHAPGKVSLYLLLHRLEFIPECELGSYREVKG